MEDNWVYLCGNCNSLCENNTRTQSIQLSISTTENCGIMSNELSIVDALSYIYGYTWTTAKISPGSLDFCTDCARLLEENYKAHQKFENVCHTQSVVYQAKTSGTHPLMDNVKTEAMLEVGLDNENSEDYRFSNINLGDDDYNNAASLSSFPTDEEANVIDEKCRLAETKNNSGYNLNDKLIKQPVLRIKRLSKKTISSICTKMKTRGSHKGTIGNSTTKRIKSADNTVFQNISPEDEFGILHKKEITYTENDEDETDDNFDGLHCQDEHSREQPRIKRSRLKRVKAILRKSVIRRNINRKECKNEDATSKKKVYARKKVVPQEDDGSLKMSMTSDGQFKCEVCSTCKPERRFLVRHLRRQHGFGIRKVPCHQNEDGTSKISVTNDGQYLCIVCGASKPQRSSLLRHIRRKHGSGEGRAQCEICGKECTKAYMKRHMFYHATKKESCKLCHKEFVDMYGHMKAVHNPEKQPFQCDQCGRKFASKATLKSHMDSHILGHVQCGTCGKRFETKFLLSCHEKTHSTERPWQCDKCPMNFRLKSGLKIHSYKHATGEQLISCEKCGKTFKFPKSLSTHMKIHKEMEERGENSFLQCDQCPKTFSNSRALYNHQLRVHRETTKFPVLQCRFCGKVLPHTSSRRNLARHEQVHIKRGDSERVAPVRILRAPKSVAKKSLIQSHTEKVDTIAATSEAVVTWEVHPEAIFSELPPQIFLENIY